MKQRFLLLALVCSWALITFAQNDYFVKTAPASKAVIDTEEERFVSEHFPLKKLCDWEEGMKFMVIPSTQDMIIATFKSYETKKTINNSDIKYKIFEYVGVEEDEDKGLVRFIFDSEDDRYYYEVKARSFESLCLGKPNMEIKTLAYLNDIDIARTVFPGRVMYLQTNVVRVDDPNSFNGFRDVKIAKNTRVTVTDVGVGSDKSYPVKLIFNDDNGNSYYWEVALSKTNSGMSTSDFAAKQKDRYFAFAFTFTDPKQKLIQELEEQYANKDLYPIVNLEVDALIPHDDVVLKTKVEILKYTPLVITAITKEDFNPNYTLHLRDRNGNNYTQDVVFTSDNVVIEQSLFNNMFAYGDLKRNYPFISEDDWRLIARGMVKKGMNKDECRLALGEPGLVRKKGNNDEFEEWIYQDRLLNFEKGLLVRSTK